MSSFAIYLSNPTSDGGDIPMTVEKAILTFQTSGRHTVVTVQQGDIFSPCQFQAPVSGKGDAPIPVILFYPDTSVAIAFRHGQAFVR